MFCINPILIEGRGIFPCGQCRFCRMMRSNTWSMRMMHEAGYWKDKVFITLTYRDEDLPEGGNLDKVELQKFIKRIRRMVEPRIIRYFACGEYGMKFGRPHYHLIVFGLGFGDKTLIEREWSHGFVKVERVNNKTCRYVTKYVTKAPLGRSRLDKSKLQRKVEFATMSKGIGLRWIEENAEVVGKRGILRHGRQVSLPRYYLDKFKGTGLFDQLVEDLKAEKVSLFREKILELINQGMTAAEIERLHKAQVVQRIEDLRSKDRLFPEGDDQ